MNAPAIVCRVLLVLYVVVREEEVVVCSVLVFSRGEILNKSETLGKTSSETFLLLPEPKFR